MISEIFGRNQRKPPGSEGCFVEKNILHFLFSNWCLLLVKYPNLKCKALWFLININTSVANTQFNMQNVSSTWQPPVERGF